MKRIFLSGLVTAGLIMGAAAPAFAATSRDTLSESQNAPMASDLWKGADLNVPPKILLPEPAWIPAVYWLVITPAIEVHWRIT